MKKFLEFCNKFGLQNVGKRREIVKRSVLENCNETVLFFSCGYDFIHSPSDRKFQGIMDLFMDHNGKYPLNIGRDCTATVRAMVATPDISVSFEGRGIGGNSGVRSALGVPIKAAGVRAGGVGNYNLQTKALEYVVTNVSTGLNKQSTVDHLVAQMNAAALRPARPWGRSHDASYLEMKADVMAYWGGDATSVGV